MEDERIVELYFLRSETAIRETDDKYGAYCCALSDGILHSRQDAEECVNDTWLWTWNHIPPERPRSLRAWLSVVVRNISLNRYRYLHAAKRNRSMEVMLSELAECAPSDESEQDDARALGEEISAFLFTCSGEDRTAFVLRYFYGRSVSDVAITLGMKPNTVSKRLELTRGRLRAWLTERGYIV